MVRILLKFFDMLIITVGIGSSLYLTPLYAKDKFLHLLKSQLAQKVHAQLYSIFLFCSKIVTQLLSASLKSEL